jgi:hypothetical protein
LGIDALERMAIPEATEALARRASTRDVLAARALARQRDRRAVAPLLELLKSDDGVVAFRGADGLRDLRDPAATEQLLAAVDHPDRIDKLVLNTAGGSQADPEVMKRIITLSMAAAENPTWETVQTRIKWLMADKSKEYDDIVASRQRVYRQPGFVGAMKDIMALQDPEIRARNLLGPDEYGAITAPTLVLWTSDDPTPATPPPDRVDDSGARSR